MCLDARRSSAMMITGPVGFKLSADIDTVLSVPYSSVSGRRLIYNS
jgi:hypothetical protein